ncbi:MAG: sugar transferase, partial [Verrucomicrobiota bacterium]|nr:sugar transferase [Verrucomicrobiota bacterium]
MAARKQEINLQFWQIVDGVVLAVVLWTAHLLRFYATTWFAWERPIQPFSEFRWLLFIIMPFGPLMLEMQGFYSHPLQKNALRSLGQILRAAFWLCLFIGMCVIFFRLPIPSRAVLLIFGAFAAIVLLGRERLAVAHLKRRARIGKFRENVLLAGTPIDMEHLRKTFDSEQFMEMDVVGEIDIESEPVANLVESLHKHSVSRVIFAGGHAHLNRIEVAIRA